MGAWFMEVSLVTMEVWLMAKAVWSTEARSTGSMLVAGEGVVGWADDIRSMMDDVVGL